MPGELKEDFFFLKVVLQRVHSLGRWRLVLEAPGNTFISQWGRWSGLIWTRAFLTSVWVFSQAENAAALMMIDDVNQVHVLQVWSSLSYNHVVVFLSLSCRRDVGLIWLLHYVSHGAVYREAHYSTMDSTVRYTHTHTLHYTDVSHLQKIQTNFIFCGRLRWLLWLPGPVLRFKEINLWP